MDYFYDAFMTFLDLLKFGYLDFQWKALNRSGFIKKYLHLCFETNVSWVQNE